MKKIGALMIIITLILILFTPIPVLFKYTIGAFGIVGGIILIAVSGYSKWD